MFMSSISLEKFLVDSNADEKLVKLVKSLTSAVKEISSLIANGAGNQGKFGGVNSSGEEQLALDVQANDVVAKYLKESGVVGVFASEELESEVKIEGDGVLAVAFDPLDGSSLVDANLAVGSIFGFYESDDFIGIKGDDQVGAMVAVYGPSLTILLTLRDGVHSFILSEGEFVLLHENMKLSEEGKYFAPGNLKASVTEESYVKLMKYWILNEYKLRYSGGMVPDIYHLFIKGGGVFCYPGYVKSPQGKLRVLYECAPMALLAEEAGGTAYAHKHERVLDVVVNILAQRMPIFIGSKNEVKKAIDVIYE